MLLTTDLHLTDNPLEEYRWGIFQVLVDNAFRYESNHIWILGDMVDRKDRHKGAFVNRLLDALQWLKVESGCGVTILKGNHDGALGLEPDFWKFLNLIQINYVTEPKWVKGCLCLPYAKNPKEEWAGLPMHQAKAIFMHQTISGSEVEDHTIEQGDEMPILPRGVPIFSGDVHKPQILRGINYIGAPYPVRFSEMWDNHIVLIQDGNWKDPKNIPVKIMRRGILDTTTVPVFANNGRYRSGDQVRVRYHLPASDMQHWPSIEAQVKASAAGAQVILASVEAVIERELPDGRISTALEFKNSREVIKKFGEQSGLDPAVIDMGIKLYEDSRR